MGLNITQTKLKEFGIPDKYIPRSDIKDYNTQLAAQFIQGKINLVVLGEHYYKKCVRLMRLAFIYNRTKELKWISQSQITYELLGNLVANPIDVLALVQLYNEPAENKKNLTGSLINNILGIGGQVLIGCSDSKSLELSFPYDLDMIETRFEIWKEKRGK